MRTRLDRQGLIRERERAGFSKSEFARAAGISPSYVTDMEHGRRTPSPAILARMADALDVDPDALLIEPALPAPAPAPEARTRHYDRLLLSPVETAVRLGISVSQVHEAIRLGLIPSVQVGKRKVMVPVRPLERRLDERGEASLAAYCPRCTCQSCGRVRKGQAL